MCRLACLWVCRLSWNLLSLGVLGTRKLPQSLDFALLLYVFTGTDGLLKHGLLLSDTDLEGLSDLRLYSFLFTSGTRSSNCFFFSFLDCNSFSRPEPKPPFPDNCKFTMHHQVHIGGLVVECLTRDRRAAGSSLTSVTALWSLSKTHLS